MCNQKGWDLYIPSAQIKASDSLQIYVGIETGINEW